jgi:hypothetical protein
MALSDKNIVITPNIGQSADPTIVFSGADSTTSAQNIALSVYPTSNGTLSFDGSAGQLFSITNSLTGSIFSVNDISGIPSIEVLDTGTIKFAQYSGNVGIGTSSPAYKLDVAGTANVTSLSTSSIVSSNTDITLSATGTGVPKLAVANGVVFTATDHPYSTGGSIVNYPRAFGSQTGYTVGMMAQGSDTNVGLVLSSKGNLPVEFWTNTVGNKQFQVSHTASTVNYAQATGAATGSGPTLSAQGSDTNIDFNIATKGTGILSFYTRAALQTIVAGQSSAVNYLQLKGQTTGNYPTISVAGSDANVGLDLITKGTGSVRLRTGSSSDIQFLVANVDSAVNYIQANGASTTNWPTLLATGSDTNVTFNFVTKGTGVHNFGTGGAGSNSQLRVSHIASAVNYVNVTGSATGNNPTLSAQGSDSNVGLLFQTKGIGSHYFYSGSASAFVINSQPTNVNYGIFTSTAAGVSPLLQVAGSDTNVDFRLRTQGTGAYQFDTGSNNNTQFRVADTSSAVNYAQTTGAATGSGPTLSARGTDTNVDFNIASKGSGSVNFATSGGTQFRVLNTGAVNNYIAVTGQSNASPGLWVAGASTDIGLNISSKGAGQINFQTNTFGSTQFSIANISSAVNYIQVTGNSTTNAPAISAQGSDAAINLVLAPKNGYLNVYSNNGSQFRVTPVASAVNFLQATGASTNNEPILSAQGSDADIALALQSKGAGAIDLATGSGGVNISNGTTVTSITRSVAGSNYTTAPLVAISAPTQSGGVQATATCTIGFPVVSIVNGGTGYSVNDVLTIVGGTYTSAGYVTVTSVSSGVITGVSIGGGYGAYSVAPTNPVSVTGGTGNSATFNLTGWTINSTFNITNAGSGYIEQPTVTFSGGGGSGAAAYATIGSVTRINTLGSQLDFYTPAGLMSSVLNNGGNSIVKSISPSGYAAFQINAASGANAYIFGYSGGSETGRITFEPSNAIVFGSSSGANQQFRISHTASAVNYIQTTGSATNNPVAFSAQGSDSNIRMNIFSKGSESVDILTNGGAVRQAKFTNTTSSVNWVQMTGAVAGSSPSYSVAGSDTNIGLDLNTKGTGKHKFNSGGGTEFLVYSFGGTPVNYWSAVGSATGSAPYLYAQGGDTNVDGKLASKGSGQLRFFTDGGNAEQVRISHTASAVNYAAITGATTGSGPTLSAQGSDTNINLSLVPKGAGSVTTTSTLVAGLISGGTF